MGGLNPDRTGCPAAPGRGRYHQHPRPGGQWNDSYAFVRLHQPSDMYGVETEQLEPSDDTGAAEKHRATRQEILEYYHRVAQKLSQKFNFTYVGGASLDMSQLTDLPEDRTYKVSMTGGENATANATIKVFQKGSTGKRFTSIGMREAKA